jgi:voltage-gated sodium channel
MLYVFLLLVLMFYTYGVSATFMFGGNDPVHFGSLPRSLLSLFQVVTLEGWSDIMNIQMYGCDRYGYEGMEALCTDPKATPLLAVFFFVTFILMGAMIIINLFIGVMTQSLDEANREQEAQDNHAKQNSIATEVENSDPNSEEKLALQMSEIYQQLQILQCSVDYLIRESAARNQQVDQSENPLRFW